MNIRSNVKKNIILYCLIFLCIIIFQCTGKKKKDMSKVTVSIHPEEVRGKARWRINKGKWHKHEEIQSKLSAGKYTVEFQEVNGWIEPADKIIQVKLKKDTSKTKKGVIEKIEGFKQDMGVKTTKGGKRKQDITDRLIAIKGFYKKRKELTDETRSNIVTEEGSATVTTEAGLHELTVTTNPPGAQVTLTGKQRNGHYQGVTPFTTKVKPDWYEMKIEKDNYQTVWPYDPTNIKTLKEVTIHKELTSSTGYDNPYNQARQAEDSENWRIAIQYYEQVNDDDREKYVSAQNRLGNIYLNHENDLEKAINAFRKAIQKKKNDYALHHNLALAYYEAKNYDQALESLNEVKKLKAMIPSELVYEVEAEVTFVRGQCHYALFMNEQDPQSKRQLGYRTLQIFNDFVDQAPRNIDQYDIKKKRATSVITKVKKELN